VDIDPMVARVIGDEAARDLAQLKDLGEIAPR